MSWASIHIYKGDISQIKALCGKISCGRLSPSWVSLADPRLDWGGVHRLAWALSLRQEKPVLSFELSGTRPIYFIFQKGILAAAHPFSLPPEEKAEAVWLKNLLADTFVDKSDCVQSFPPSASADICTANAFAAALSLTEKAQQGLWKAFCLPDELEGAALIAQTLQLPLFVRSAQLAPKTD